MITDKKPDIRTARRIEIKFLQFVIILLWNKKEIWKSTVLRKDVDKMPFITIDWMVELIGTSYRPVLKWANQKTKYC